MTRSLALLLFLLPFASFAQMIKGQILIYGSENPLPYASVYYDGMYKGVISDENGNFQLTQAASGKTPIIISAVGYHSTSIPDYSSSEFLKVYLQPKTYNLDAVVVTFDGMTREEKEAIFKREFIGITENSMQCEILNMDDISLVYNRKKQTVEAFAKDPILLHNKALGFKITYYLDVFQYTRRSVFFAGNYFFEPDTILTGRDLARVEKKRKEAYLGSRMHFIRALYNDRLNAEGYKIRDSLNKRVNYRELVVATPEGKNILMRSSLAVFYARNGSVTVLNKKQDFTYIDKSGFYDPNGISWAGDMGDQRMGDLLPFEYGRSDDRRNGQAEGLEQK